MERQTVLDTLLGLFDGTDERLDSELYENIKLLLEKKSVTAESDLNDHIPRVLKFIEEELALQKEISEKTEDDRQSDFDALNKLFINVLTHD